jgi:hypothetical protein
MLSLAHGSWSISVYALFGTLAGTVVLTGTGAIATLRDRTGGPPPEGRPFHGYSPEAVRMYLQEAGGEGAALYRRALLQDVAFLLLYGAGFVLLIDGTLGRLFADPNNPWRFILDAVGAAAAIVDAGEDAVLALVVGKSGLTRSALIPAANALTFCKWLLVLASVIGVATGAVLLGLRGSGWI